jgi:NADH dehydrogenase FAD-containing subunit
MKKKILVVGGSFTGLACAKELVTNRASSEKFEVILVRISGGKRSSVVGVQ